MPACPQRQPATINLGVILPTKLAQGQQVGLLLPFIQRQHALPQSQAMDPALMLIAIPLRSTAHAAPRAGIKLLAVPCRLGVQLLLALGQAAVCRTPGAAHVAIACRQGRWLQSAHREQRAGQLKWDLRCTGG